MKKRHLLLGILLLALAACTLASPAPTPTPTGPAGWPQDVDQAAAVLLTWLDAEQTHTLRATARGDLILYHRAGHGRAQRVWLWAGNTALLQSCCQALSGDLDRSLWTALPAWCTRMTARWSSLSGPGNCFRGAMNLFPRSLPNEVKLNIEVIQTFQARIPTILRKRWN
jgi:hypothetical protein